MNYESIKKGSFVFKERRSFICCVQRGFGNTGRLFYIRIGTGRIELDNVGKSGMINQDDHFKRELLRSSINKNKLLFDGKFVDGNIEALDIYWFAAFDDKNKDLLSFWRDK